MWDHIGFVLSYSIEYKKHWVVSKLKSYLRSPDLV
jgi:hypothetical protein